MKRKCILWVALGVFVLVGVMIAYLFKPMTMNDIYKEPNFSGIVTEVSDKTITVSVNENEDAFTFSDTMIVSLNVKLKDSMTHFKVGDKVKVYYDGVIAETYPAQIDTVYAILLINE